eukprot:CAMPEP_0115559156 /NCGR_PEP_ID=MMETSP0271-20121206/99815_1 /TAXON_ID=71861 /ORGANISM="Scrippsiella trochoidea, Strain CCMP3099" /LENGTH=173 /DNA_ID=CAMNT_0002993207 /DNA_START=112 /DNA_END=631 /DNA_ORIENTATION=+
MLVSCLHGLLLAGGLAATCHSLAQACYDEDLCHRLLARDLDDELRATARKARKVRPGGSCKHCKALGVAVRGGAVPETLLWLSSGHDCLLAAAREGGKVVVMTAVVEIRDMAKHLSTLQPEHWDSAAMVAAKRNLPLTAAAAAAAGCDIDQEHASFGTALHMAAFVGAAPVAA